MWKNLYLSCLNYRNGNLYYGPVEEANGFHKIDNQAYNQARFEILVLKQGCIDVKITQLTYW